MRLIVLGVPHTITDPEWSGCAFTGKVLKFLKMMNHRGHDIIHIGHADSQIPAGIQHYSVTNNETLCSAYGEEYVYEQTWKRTGFGGVFDINDHAYQVFTANTIELLQKIEQPNDMLLCFFGWGHKAIADAMSDMIVIEPGIGYPSAFARWRIYESHAIMNAMYGPKSIGTCDMDWYHRVIPNYFDPEDFTYSEDKDDYILYLGRVYNGKGLDTIIQATEAAGRKLVIAGPGRLEDMGYAASPQHVTEMGYADPRMRRQLLSRASAVAVASGYLEPFAGIQVEAWLSGTPMITPDWAAFAELNQHGVTGYRCNTFRDFVEAFRTTEELFPEYCRRHAEQFTLERVAPRYERYFSDVLEVYTGRGWYALPTAK